MPQLSRSLVHEIPCPADRQTPALPTARLGEAGLCFCALQQCMTLQQPQDSQQSFTTPHALPSSQGATHAARPAPSRYGNIPQIVASREVAHFFLFNAINSQVMFSCIFSTAAETRETFPFFLKQGRNSQPFIPWMLKKQPGDTCHKKTVESAAINEYSCSESETCCWLMLGADTAPSRVSRSLPLPDHAQFSQCISDKDVI